MFECGGGLLKHDPSVRCGDPVNTATHPAGLPYRCAPRANWTCGAMSGSPPPPMVGHASPKVYWPAGGSVRSRVSELRAHKDTATSAHLKWHSEIGASMRPDIRTKWPRSASCWMCACSGYLFALFALRTTSAQPDVHRRPSPQKQLRTLVDATDADRSRSAQLS